MDGDLGAETAEDERARAKDAAFSLLAARPRARRELIDRLRRKGMGEDAVMWACSEMERLELIDDRAFARAFVRDRLVLKPKGARALTAELTRKGVAAEVAADAIAHVMHEEEVAEPDLCVAAAEKWLRTHASRAVSPDDAESRRRLERRLAGYLTRRGFTADAVRRALDAARDATDRA